MPNGFTRTPINRACMKVMLQLSVQAVIFAQKALPGVSNLLLNLLAEVYCRLLIVPDCGTKGRLSRMRLGSCCCSSVNC